MLLCKVVFCTEQTSESELHDRHFFFFFFNRSFEIARVILFGFTPSSSPMILKTSREIRKPPKPVSPNQNDWCKNEFSTLYYLLPLTLFHLVPFEHSYSILRAVSLLSCPHRISRSPCNNHNNNLSRSIDRLNGLGSRLFFPFGFNAEVNFGVMSLLYVWMLYQSGNVKTSYTTCLHNRIHTHHSVIALTRSIKYIII